MPNNSQVPPTSSVGYKNPPKHSQFKPGKSGNPRGRPKGKVPVSQMLAKLLAIKMKVNAGGTEKTVTRQEALFMSLISTGLKGGLSASKLLIQLLLDHEAAENTNSRQEGQRSIPLLPIIGIGPWPEIQSRIS